MKQHSFHNTTNLSGAELKDAIQRAKKQEDAVLLLFKNWRKPMSPSKVWDIMMKAGKQWPLTSIRRALSNLTSRQDLIKTDKQVPGMYGDPETLWEINAIRYPVTHESEKMEQAKLFNDTKAA